MKAITDVIYDDTYLYKNFKFFLQLECFIKINIFVYVLA